MAPTRPLPGRPLVRRHWKPWPMEGVLRDATVVQGEVPDDLAGTLFRIGPNPRYAPLSGMYNAWMGDGMVHAVTLAEGKVHYRNRWVRTPKFLAEERAGGAVFDYVLPTRHPLLATGLEVTRSTPQSAGVATGTCNTSLTMQGGQLLAWGEGESTPTILDPVTLETVGFPAWTTSLGPSTGPKAGPHGYAGGHPRVCPVTGEILFFTIAVEPPYLTVHLLDPKRGQLRSVPLDSPYPAYVHDFMITEDHAVVVVSPVTMSQDRVRDGRGFFSWEPELGTHLAVLPRAGGPDDVIWLDLDDNVYSLHPQNAYVTDGGLVFDTPEFPIGPFPVNDLVPREQFRGLTAHLARWHVDLRRVKVERQQLDDRNIELPRCDERSQGLGYRYGYNLATGRDLDDYLYTSVIRYDMATGATSEHDFGAGTSACEPVFAPRAAGAPEGAGYLLTYVYRFAEDRSDFVILDAERLEDEPVATVALPHRVPFSAHGCWADGVVAVP